MPVTVTARPSTVPGLAPPLLGGAPPEEPSALVQGGRPATSGVSCVAVRDGAGPDGGRRLPPSGPLASEGELPAQVLAADGGAGESSAQSARAEKVRPAAHRLSGDEGSTGL